MKTTDESGSRALLAAAQPVANATAKLVSTTKVKLNVKNKIK